jgi:hypothetical protein
MRVIVLLVVKDGVAKVAKESSPDGLPIERKGGEKALPILLLGIADE